MVCCRRTVVILCISILIKVCFASRSKSSGSRRSIDRNKLKDYINRQIDTYVALTGKAVSDSDRDATLNDFTRDRMFSMSPGLKLIDIAELQIILDQERTNLLTVNQDCNILDQVDVDAFYTSPASFSEDTLRRTYDHLKRLADSGKNYCRFFSYLVCREDPATPGTHKCLCPSTSLTWGNNKCVFKMNERCDDLGDGYLEGAFPTFDFVERNYVTNVPPVCELNYQCKPGYNLCELDSDFNVYALEGELISFLTSRIVEDKASGMLNLEGLAKLMRSALMDITAPHKQADYRALSLELYMSNRLRDYGQLCDYSKDVPLDELMKPYGRPDYKDHSDTRLNHDPLRQAFQLMVMRLGSSVFVCNHLNLLRCTPAGICDCKENLVWDQSTFFCRTKAKYPCPSQVKIFSLSLPYRIDGFAGNGNFPYSVPYSTIKDRLLWGPFHYIYEDDDEVFFNIHYYTTMSIGCEAGTDCKDIELVTQDYCLSPTESGKDIAVLSHSSSSKFILEFDDACTPADQAQLFLQLTTTSSFGSTLDVVKSTLEAINSSPVTYCNIRNHATCSSAGKCACVPPAVHQNDMCISPIYGECGHIKSDFHQELDKLVLPLIDPATLTSTNNLFCPSNLICYDDVFIKKKLCTCASNKYGEHCDIPHNHHVGNLLFESLPASLHTPEGRKLIAEFHEAMFNMEKLMIGKFDYPCKTGDHLDLETIIKFTTDFRDMCECRKTYISAISVYACSIFPCRDNPTFSRGAIEAIIQTSKDLASKSASLCKRTEGFTCISNSCGCAEDLYFVNGGCFFDLGAEGCDFGLRQCRVGATCTFVSSSSFGRDRCISTNPIANKVSPEGLTTAEYVHQVKQKLVEFLRKSSSTGLANLRKTHENQHCNPSDETALKKIMTQLDPLLSTIRDGNLQHERGEVRRMETLAIEVDDFLHRHSKFCRETLECSPDTNKCERKQKSYTKSHASALRILNQEMVSIILTQVIFIIVKCRSFCSVTQNYL